MNEVVINESLGSFGVSELATLDFGVDNHTARTDPKLIEAVSTLGTAANGPNSNLRIVSSLGPRWHIVKHCGFERLEDGHPPKIRRKALRFQVWRELRNAPDMTDAEMSIKLGRSQAEITQVQHGTGRTR